jgi:hypothetical protein
MACAPKKVHNPVNIYRRLYAGCVFTTKYSSTVLLDSAQAYFKGSKFKVGLAENIPRYASYGVGIIPFSPLRLDANSDEESPFLAVALEDVSFDLPEGTPPVNVQTSSPGEAADKRVYSDAPVGVFVDVTSVNPNNTAVVTVGGNLDAARAVTPPPQSAFSVGR